MSREQGPIYGGQAVIEGVMIRGQRNIAVACRRPDGSVGDDAASADFNIHGAGCGAFRWFAG